MPTRAQFGKYEIIERIATGGMAEVFLARSTGVAGFEKRLVIKRIRPELADDPRFVNMFINEAKIGVHLNHPNVVQVYELGRVGSSWYMAMEHLDGRDLTRLVKVLRAQEARLDSQLAVFIVAEVCRGLSYAHRRMDGSGQPLGLVHQDVSPHNILVTFAGEVKLVDFGIARLMNTVEEHAQGRPGGGKYAYMSPEQAQGEHLDHRTDIFSTGIVLWELLVGHRLFQHPDPEEKLRRVQQAIIPHPGDEGVDIDEALWGILSRTLSRHREERPQTAAELEEELRAWLFDSRSRADRAAVAQAMREAFPGAADQTDGDLDVRQLVQDVDRLAARDRTQSSTPITEQTPQPIGRLPETAGERKQVTVLIVDIDGLTDMSSRVEPERLFTHHLQLLRWVRHIVDRYGGVVPSAVDDHVTIFFGVPRTRVDDLPRALECAMHLQRDVGQLRSKGMALDLAIGVHSGEVTVGRRTRSRVRYVARGDTTRLARRLSAMADHGEILVSQRILATAEASFVLRRGPGVPSRGGKPELASYRLVERRHGVAHRRGGGWIGRGKELAIVRSALVLLAANQGSALLITGDTGTGKSRFAREIRDLAGRRHIPCFAARATAGERPLEVFKDLLLDVLGLDTEPSLDELTAQTERLIELGLADSDLLALRSLLGLPTSRTPESSEIWQALRRVIRALARQRALILCLDDLHNISDRELPAALQWVESCLELPVVLLISWEGGIPAALQQHTTSIHLGPLARPAQRRLLSATLGTRRLSEELEELVCGMSEGNPRYLREIVTWLLEQGRVAVDDNQARLVGDLDQSAMPHSLAGLIASRIDALDMGSKGALQLAAVAGDPFTQELIGEAAGLEDTTLLIRELSHHGLITRSGDGWALSSALVREVALRGILGVQRRDYHRLVAGAIEVLYEDNLTGRADDLVIHCAEGGRLLDAAKYAHTGGQELEQRQELERARRLYRTGLDCIRRADKTPDSYDLRVQGEASLNCRLGVVSLLLGDTSAGEAALHLALDVAADVGLPWIEVRAHLELGRSYLHRGKFTLASAHLGQARALLRFEDDAALEREALEAAAALAFEQGHNQDAEALWREALDRAEGDPAAAARCQIGLANRYIRSGASDDAALMLTAALASARKAGDRILEGRVLNNIGLLQYWSGDGDSALQSFQHALEVREGIGYTRGVIINYHNIGDVHFQAGRHSRAFVAFARSRELAEDMVWDRGVLLNDVFLAYLRAHRGESDLEDILCTVARANDIGDREIAATGSQLAGRFLIEQGRYDAARDHLAQALENAHKWELAPMVSAVTEMLDELSIRSEGHPG